MVDERRPFPLGAFLVFELLLSFPLALPLGQSARVGFFLVLCLLYFNIITSTTGTPSGDWSLGLAITPQLLKALDMFVLNRAEAVFRRNDALDTDPAKFGFWKKLAWASELIHTPRGVGWNWEIPYVSYLDTESRSSYLCTRLPRIALYYLALDFLGDHIPNSSSQAIPVGQPLSLAAIIPTWSYAISAYLHLWLVHTIPATILVALGIGKSSSYPYVMGPIGAMASIRCFWGRTFHQAVRRQITSVGDFVCRVLLRSRQGGFVSAYGKLAIGFAIGGLTHAVGGYMAGYTGSWVDKTGAISFFFYQFCGVVMEDLVMGLWRFIRGGVDWRNGHMDGGKTNYGKDFKWWRLDNVEMTLGYIVVLVWFTITLPPYVENMRQVGILDTRLAPVQIFSR